MHMTLFQRKHNNRLLYVVPIERDNFQNIILKNFSITYMNLIEKKNENRKALAFFWRLIFVLNVSNILTRVREFLNCVRNYFLNVDLVEDYDFKVYDKFQNKSF